MLLVLSSLWGGVTHIPHPFNPGRGIWLVKKKVLGFFSEYVDNRSERVGSHRRCLPKIPNGMVRRFRAPSRIRTGDFLRTGEALCTSELKGLVLVNVAGLPVSATIILV